MLIPRVLLYRAGDKKKRALLLLLIHSLSSNGDTYLLHNFSIKTKIIPVIIRFEQLELTFIYSRVIFVSLSLILPQWFLRAILFPPQNYGKLPILNIILSSKNGWKLVGRRGGESLIPLDRSPIGLHWPSSFRKQAIDTVTSSTWLQLHTV